MTAQTWDDVDLAVGEAIADGWLADFRGVLAVHKTRRFRDRKAPSDVMGVCTHHTAATNQKPHNTARYHTGPNNHVQEGGCPGILYTLVISQDIEPDRVILANDLRAQTWSQGKGGTAAHPEWSGDENRHLVGALCMGDFNESNRRGRSGDPTHSQIERWLKATSWLASLFGFDGRGYFGHYHFGKAHCPGKVLRTMTECKRLAAPPGLVTDEDWQNALLRWDAGCLPQWGADDDWGYESKTALVRFERAHKHRADGIRDPFTELLLVNKYPAVARI